MNRPRLHDAVERALVRLGDGRTGRLLYVPGGRGRSSGRMARVELHEGAVISVPPTSLELVPTGSWR